MSHLILQLLSSSSLPSSPSSLDSIFLSSLTLLYLRLSVCDGTHCLTDLTAAAAAAAEDAFAGTVREREGELSQGKERKERGSDPSLYPKLIKRKRGERSASSLFLASFTDGPP